MGMVELLPLDEADDRKTVHQLVQRHHQYTGSGVAERLLQDWDSSCGRFHKVIPTEYRKVLEQMHLDSDAMKLAAV
jgi:glutamate synthase (NADPH/NADH) large chain